MTLVILVCAATLTTAECTPSTAMDVIERPATELECAMPWTALPDVIDSRNIGTQIVMKCER